MSTIVKCENIADNFTQTPPIVAQLVTVISTAEQDSNNSLPVRAGEFL